ncbi:hypothetical protein EB796_008135 [Bugula neritina]|uniref:SLC18B1 n=1 Tax=Bugula neritina TaxID=10212 RepID=A0A7J7K4J9_BUGNE|nr:hypothetical protein EB796_008135 [Bugula neritina]
MKPLDHCLTYCRQGSQCPCKLQLRIQAITITIFCVSNIKMHESEEQVFKGLLEEEDTDTKRPFGKETDHSLTKCREYLLLGVLLFSQFVALCTDTFLFPFFPQEAKSKGLSNVEIGTIFSSFEFARFVTAPVLGYLFYWISPRRACIAGTALSAVSCISFGAATYAPNQMFLPLCITIRILAGSATASLSVSVMTILLKHTTFQTSTIVGFVEMIQGGGYAAGPALGAALQQIGGYSCMFWTLGVLIGVSCLLQIFIVSTDVSEKKQSNSSIAMIKIPGVLVLTFHCFILSVLASSRSAGLSNFLSVSFGTDPGNIGLLFGIWATLYLIGCLPMAKLVNKGFIYTPMVIGCSLCVFIDLLMGPSPLMNFIFQGKR